MASASQIKAGEAYVSLSMNDADMAKGLQDASKKLKSWGAGLEKIGGGMMGAGLGILAPLAAAVSTFTSTGTELQNASLRLNETVENLSALKSAAEESGVEFETLEHSLNHFQRSLQDGNAAKAFREMHLNAADLKGKGLAEQFTAVADSLAKVKDNGVAAAAAQALFGKAGEKFLGLARESEGGLGNLVEEMKDLGLMMSGEDAKNAKEFGTNLKRIEGMAKSAAMAIGGELVGAMMKFKGPVMGAVHDVTDFIKESGGLVVTVAGVGIGLVAAGTSFIALGAAISGVGSIAGALGTALGFLASPIGVVTTLGAGLVYLWSTTEDGKATITSFASDWKSAWAGITDAFKAGDIALAFKILMKTLQLEWARFWDSIWKEANKTLGKIMPKGLEKSPLSGLVNAYANGIPLIGLDLERYIRKQRPGEWTKEDEADYQKRSLELMQKHFRIQKGLDGKADLPDSDIEKYKRELDELTKQARSRAESTIQNPPSKNNSMSNPESMGLSEASKGTFSSYAIGQSLAFGDKVSEKIAQNTEKIADNTEKMTEEQKRMNEIFARWDNPRKPVFKDDGG